MRCGQIKGTQLHVNVLDSRVSSRETLSGGGSVKGRHDQMRNRCGFYSKSVVLPAHRKCIDARTIMQCNFGFFFVFCFFLYK